LNIENLSTLKIHKLTQAQYERELAAGRIDENALYMTPDEEVDMSIYATVDQLNDKADKAHTHKIDDVTNLQQSLDKMLADAKSYTDEATADFVDAEHNHDDRYYTESEIDGLISGFATKDYVDNTASVNYDESIIGLSIDGQVITYIKGDGSQHTIVTQDTNTTYSLATDEVTGLTKLYATIGSAEDGTMTQKAIKTELDKKVGVTIDSSNDMLIFTI
jgi:hypothetical protein